MPSFSWIAVRRHEQGATDARHDLQALREEIRRRDERIAFLESLLGLDPGAAIVPLSRARESSPGRSGGDGARSALRNPTPATHRRA